MSLSIPVLINTLKTTSLPAAWRRRCGRGACAWDARRKPPGRRR
jgi:hypothetical protein